MDPIPRPTIHHQTPEINLDPVPPTTTTTTNTRKITTKTRPVTSNTNKTKQNKHDKSRPRLSMRTSTGAILLFRSAVHQLSLN